MLERFTETDDRPGMPTPTVARWPIATTAAALAVIFLTALTTL